MPHAPAAARCCSECGTATTSQWRYGHNGATLMCNACGIRWRRKNRADTSKRRRPGPRAPKRAPPPPPRGRVTINALLDGPALPPKLSPLSIRALLNTDDKPPVRPYY